MKHRSFGILCVLTLAGIVSAQVSTSQIDAVFAPLKSNDAPGVAVLVLRDGKSVFRGGYGVTDLRTKRPIDSQTNFRLASFTKQFTATCIMLLVRDGKLHYDDHLTDIFPEFPEYGPITIRNLLNHTSGLPDYEDILMKQYPNTPPDQIPQILDAGVLKSLEQQSAGQFPAGSKWQYSNSGYAVLAMIVEKVSGKPFGQFLHDRIFAPLKMNNTLAYEKGKNEVPHRAYGHSKQKDGALQETDQSPTSAVLGDGGIYSSIDDLEKWDRALREHTLLSEAEMQPALTPVQTTGGPATFKSGKPVSYGFGWFLDPYEGHRRMHHDGETIGFRTTIQRFTDDNLTVIVLANRTDVDPEALALKVADLYLTKQ